jgi:hypothetical protein
LGADSSSEGKKMRKNVSPTGGNNTKGLTSFIEFFTQKKRKKEIIES